MSYKSPCADCVRKAQDKNECAAICKRLHGYMEGNEYYNQIKIPTREEIEDQLGAPGKEEETGPDNSKTCKVPGCDRPVKARGLCGPCYDKWRSRGIPGMPKFEAIRPQKKKTTKPPKTPTKQAKREPRVVETFPASEIALDLGQCPRIRDIVFSVARQYCVTPQHVVISLMGQAVASRKESFGLLP